MLILIIIIVYSHVQCVGTDDSEFMIMTAQRYANIGSTSLPQSSPTKVGLRRGFGLRVLPYMMDIR